MPRTLLSLVFLLFASSLFSQTIKPSEFLSYRNESKTISRQKIYKEFIHYFFIKRNKPTDSAVLAILEYNPNGSVTRATRYDVNIPNGSRSEYYYDEFERLISITTAFPQSRIPPSRVDIQYNEQGLESARSNSSENGALIEWREYDSSKRLTKMYIKNGPARKYLSTRIDYENNGKGFIQTYYQSNGLEDYKEQRKYLSDSLSYEVHISAKNMRTRLKALVESDKPDRIINEKRYEELITDFTEFIFTYNEDGTLFECKVFKKDDLIGLVRHYYYANEE